MFTTLKKSLVAFSAFAITVASTLGFGAQANALSFDLQHNFQDVPSYSYYSEALNWAVSEGIVEARERFYPHIPLKRSELAKMTLAAMQVPVQQSSYQPFRDVPKDAWFSPHVETAEAFGIVNGSTDQFGVPTGYYYPAGPTARSHAAKTLMLAFGLEPQQCDQVFPDVNYNAWYGAYVDSACAYDVLRGDHSGHARPADPVNRAEFVTMLYRAVQAFEGDTTVSPSTPSEPTVPTPDPTTPTVPSTSGGDTSLLVEISPTTPLPTTIPADAAAVEYTTLALSAAGGDVQVDAVRLMRNGLGSRNNFTEVWLSVDGFTLGAERSFNSENEAIITLGRDFIIVPEGETVLLTVKASMSSNVGANLQNRIGLSTSADITTDADEVLGTFPLYGNSMTTSSYTMGSINFSQDGNDSTVDVGDIQTTIGAFELENDAANNESFVVSTLDFEINGRGSYQDLDNVGIYYLGELVTNQVTPFDGRLRFTFDDEGFPLEEGKTREFLIKADIVGGENNDTIVLQLDEDNGLTAYVANSTRAYAVDVNRIDPANGSLGQYTINAGSIVFARYTESPGPTDLVPGTNNATLFKSQINTGEMLEVEEMRLYLDAEIRTGADGSTPITAGQCANAAGMVDIISSKIDDIRIWNDSRFAAGSETSLAFSPAGTFASSECSIQNAYYLFNGSFTLNPGVNVLSVTADISNDASAGETFRVGFDNAPDTWFEAEYIFNGQDVEGDNVSGSALGSIFTIESANLAGFRQDGFSSPENLVAGSINTLLMKFKIQANDTGDITISSLAVQDGPVDVEGQLLTGMGLYDAVTGQQLSRSVQNLGPDDRAQFDGLDISIPSGGFREFEVRGTVSSAWDTSTSLQLFVTDIVARDSQNNDADISYPDCINSGCSPNDAIASTIFDVNDSARIIFAFKQENDTEGVITETGYCSTYTCARKVAELRLKPLYDDIRLKQLVLTSDDGIDNYVGSFGTFFLVHEETGATMATGTLSDAPQGVNEDGEVTFDGGLNYLLEKDDYQNIGVYAAIPTVDHEDESGAMIKLYLPAVTDDTFRAESASVGGDVPPSQVTNQAIITSSSIQEYVIRKAKPIITYLNGDLDTSNIGVNMNDYTVYKFAVAAEANDLEVARFTFNIDESAGITSDEYKLYISGNSNPLNVVGVIPSAGVLVIEPDSAYEISADGQAVFELKADISVTNPAQSQSLAVELTGDADTTRVTTTQSALSSAEFLWSDMSSDSHDASSADWTNGHFIDSFDVSTQNIYFSP